MRPNASAPKRFFAAAKKDDNLELLIYDSIGESYWGGGVSADSVKKKLDEAGDVKTITLRINSPGGDVFEGSAIYSLLSQHKAKVECYVDGLAASAAFTIAMAADTIHISEAAMMMCHNAWGMCMGYASDMTKTADVLNKISKTMCDIYSARAGMDSDEMQKLMDAETWMTADEAVEYGFAEDVIKREPNDEESDKARAALYDLSKFKNSPKAAKKEKDTKSVSGKACTKDCFAYRPDDNKDNWKLPIKSPDSDTEWEKTHIRDAISRWSSTDMPDKTEKDQARGRIKAAAKAHDIEISDDSLAKLDADDQPGKPDPEPDSDDCKCSCAECKAGDCQNCSMSDCADPNCEHKDDGDEDDKQQRAEILAEIELLEQEFNILAQ